MAHRKEIMKQLNDPNLALYCGKGYWYFIYDDGKQYHSHPVNTMRLNDLPVETWVKIGQDFILWVKQGGKGFLY